MLRTSLLSGVAAFVLALIACSNKADPGADAGTTSSTSSSGDTSNGGSSNGNPSSSSSTSSGSTGNNPPPAAEVEVLDRTINVDGRERAYKLVIPKTYDANKTYPLIVALHGDGGSSTAFITESGLDRAAGKDAVMAFPDQAILLDYQGDDQKFVVAVVGAVKAERKIDPKKVWGYGYSKGAFQLSELVCLPNQPFTAVAAHAGGAPADKDGDS